MSGIQHKSKFNNKNNIQLNTNALHNVFEYEKTYASYTAWQNSANSARVSTSLCETKFQVNASLLAVRFHWTSSTLYNQTNFIFIYLLPLIHIPKVGCQDSPKKQALSIPPG